MLSTLRQCNTLPAHHREVNLQQLDGEAIQITGEPGQVVKPDDIWVVRQKGMPRQNGNGRGNLFVRFKIEFPDSISHAAQEAPLDPNPLFLFVVLFSLWERMICTHNSQCHPYCGRPGLR